jgi:hypothetical protein
VWSFITPGTLPNLHVNPGSNSLDILESPISPEKQLEQVNLAPALGTQLINFASDLRDQTQVQVSKASAGIARGAKLANQANEHYFGQPEAEPEKARRHAHDFGDVDPCFGGGAGGRVLVVERRS